MMGYSVRPRDRIFVEGYGFFSFAKNMGKIIGKNISKNLSGKYSQKLLIMLNNLPLQKSNSKNSRSNW